MMKVNFKPFFIIICLVVINLAFANSDHQINLDKNLLLQLQKPNKKAVIAILKNSKEWDEVLDKIATGNSKWLLAANNIKPYTDASNAESLNFAVALAMPKNPDGVLKLVNQNFNLEEVCTVPYIEADDEVVKHYLKQTIQALSKSQQKIKAQSCLKILAQIYSNSK